MVAPFPENPSIVHGGVEAAASRLVSAMWTCFELEYDLLVYEPRANEASYERWPHVNVLPLRPVTLGGRTSARRMRRLLTELERSGKYDVIHIQGPASFVSRSSRQLVTIHGISERDSFYSGRRRSQRLRAQLLRVREIIGRRRARNVIAISRYVLSVIPGSSGQRSWQIPNAVDPVFFSTVRQPRAEKIVLYAGRLVELKNVLGLLGAFELAWRRSPELRLRIVGEGINTPYGRLCSERANQFPIEVVTFVGECDVTGLRDEMSQACLLVLFSLQENAPMVISEAHATGLPVVASRVGGVAEMMTSISGELVESGDEVALAAAIGRVANWDLSLERTGAIRDSAAQYRTDFVAKATYSVYQEICKSASAAGEPKKG
jgi:glycosyltransferase involved in cell wall biosynthesis